MKYIFHVIILFSTFCLSAQDFEFYADVMINASDAKHRIYAADHFADLFEKELQKDNSFATNFENLSWVSIQYAEDRSFRTLTWQIDKGNGRYAYDGYIQRPDSPAMRFKGDRGVNSNKVDRSIKWEEWKGGIIYKILDIPSDNGMEYYLLSFNQLDQFSKQKSLEHVQWMADGVILGAVEKFEIPERSKKAKRITITYSADSNASITYQTEAKQFVVDHLVPIPGRIPGQGPTMAPDGSYIAYGLSADGSWKYQDKLFDQKFDAPPRGGISSGGKDILGRPKN